MHYYTLVKSSEYGQKEYYYVGPKTDDWHGFINKLESQLNNYIKVNQLEDKYINDVHDLRFKELCHMIENNGYTMIQFEDYYTVACYKGKLSYVVML